MNYVAVEFDNGLNNTHVLGYLRTPDDFHPLWSIGFRQYIIDTYKVNKGTVKIYPLRVRLTSETMGKDIVGYKNMEDDFNMALSSDFYYPISPTTNSIRRQWSKLSPKSPDYCAKDSNL